MLIRWSGMNINLSFIVLSLKIPAVSNTPLFPGRREGVNFHMSNSFNNKIGSFNSQGLGSVF